MHAARKTRCVRAYERVSFVQRLFQVKYRSAPNGSLGTYFRLGSQPLTNHRSTMSQNSITTSVDFFQPFPCSFAASLALIKALVFTRILCQSTVTSSITFLFIYPCWYIVKWSRSWDELSRKVNEPNISQTVCQTNNESVLLRNGDRSPSCLSFLRRISIKFSWIIRINLR